jgi:AMMECR1 domain-containing protein
MNAPALRACAAAVAILALALRPPAPAHATEEFEAYRALSRAPAGARLLEIARETMRGTDVSATGGKVSTRDPAPPTADLEMPPSPEALYVTLVKGTTTRACVGHEPPHNTYLPEAVRELAREVRTADRRRPPVRDDELNGLRLVIGFAGAAEPVERAGEVDPGREGLLIESEGGRVAFLPGEARTVAWALREARRIGVLLGPAAAARYYRFEVVTLSEPVPAAPKEKDSHVPR